MFFHSVVCWSNQHWFSFCKHLTVLIAVSPALSELSSFSDSLNCSICACHVAIFAFVSAIWPLIVSRSSSYHEMLDRKNHHIMTIPSKYILCLTRWTFLSCSNAFMSHSKVPNRNCDASCVLSSVFVSEEFSTNQLFIKGCCAWSVFGGVINSIL
jgi:hypothetical protein